MKRLRSLAVALLLLAVAHCAGAQDRPGPLESTGITPSDAAQEISAKLARIGSVERRPTRDGGSKESWTLTATRFSHVAIRSDREGRLLWLTAFVRPGQEIPFTELANPAQADGISEKTAAWNVKTPRATYRLTARGRNGKAQVISLFPAETKLAD